MEVSGDVGCIIFYKGLVVIFVFLGYIEYLFMFNEFGEVLIIFFFSEMVMGCVMNIEVGVVGVL